MESGKRDFIAAYKERLMVLRTGPIVQVQESGILVRVPHHSFTRVLRQGELKNYPNLPYVIVYTTYVGW
jgi:ABC-type antimicrobial peptide transport system ATPase subunit